MHLNEMEDDSFEHNFSGEEEKDDPRKYDSDLPAPLPLFGSGENEIALTEKSMYLDFYISKNMVNLFLSSSINF